LRVPPVREEAVADAWHLYRAIALVPHTHDPAVILQCSTHLGIQPIPVAPAVGAADAGALRGCGCDGSAGCKD